MLYFYPRNTVLAPRMQHGKKAAAGKNSIIVYFTERGNPGQTEDFVMDENTFM